MSFASSVEDVLDISNVPGNRTRTCPGNQFVAPENCRFVLVLHHSIVPPKPHAIDCPPFLAFLIIRIIVRFLKDICGILGKRMLAPLSPKSVGSRAQRRRKERAILFRRECSRVIGVQI